MEFQSVLRALELAGVSGIRPSWVLVATSVLGALGYVVFPEPVRFLASWPGVGAMVVFAVIEHLAERDTDMLQVFGAVQLGLSAATALLGTSLAARTSGYAPPWAVQIAAVVLAVATIGLRRKLKLKLMEVSANVSTPTRWLSRVEEGSVLFALGLVVLAPLVLLGLVVALAVFAAFFAGTLKVLDLARRVPCDGCGHKVRREAQRCPKCKKDLAPRVVLELPVPLLERVAPKTPEQAAES